VQVPLMQQPPPPHVSFGQQVCPSLPHGWHVPVVPPAGTMHVVPPAVQVSFAQHGSPEPPQPVPASLTHAPFMQVPPMAAGHAPPLW
jgi:hypothetical protein